MHRGRAERLLCAIRAHADVIDARFVRHEARAVLAVARHRPLDRQLRRPAGRRRDFREDAAVVHFHICGIEDLDRQLDRFARLHAIRRRRDVDLLGDAVDEPADETPPEHRVRRVGNRHLGVHAPHEGILDRHRERLAAPVPLIREHDLILTAVVDAGQEHGRAGLRLAHRVHARHRRHVVPLRARRFLVARDLRHRERRARAGGTRLKKLGEVLRVGVLDDDREDLADRRAAPAALGERPAAAEHQQPAAPLVHEIGDHPELLGRERRRLDAAQNESAILEELFARLGKAGDQLVGVRDGLTVVLVLGRPGQRHHLQVLVVFDRAAHELVLEARLAFVVEGLLGAIVDLDQRVARVVLRHLLACLRRDLELEEARARLRRGEAHFHRRRFALRRQRHLLRADDAPVVFDAERHGLAAVAGLRQHDVDDERRALEDRPRRLDARHLDVVRETLLADADGEHRNRSRFQAGERLVDRGVGRVGAVRHHHEAGQRQPGELVAGAIKRLAEPCGRAAELEVAGRRDAVGRGREAEEADDKSLRERRQQPGVRAVQLLLDERAPRLAVAVRNRHASRVVQQNAEEILLRHRGFEDQRRPEQAKEQHGERREPQADEHDTVARPIGRGHAAISQQREDRGRRSRRDDQQHRAGQAPAEVALLEHEGRVFEQEAKELVQHQALILTERPING